LTATISTLPSSADSIRHSWDPVAFHIRSINREIATYCNTLIGDRHSKVLEKHINRCDKMWKTWHVPSLARFFPGTTRTLDRG
jgi:hypothetical protein